MARKNIEIVAKTGEMEIRGQKLKIYPMPVIALYPVYHKLVGTKATQGETTVELLKSLTLTENVELCCDLEKKQIEALTDSEKLEIMDKALELDPEVLKKSLQLVGKLKS